jgi:hypothetical protein
MLIGSVKDTIGARGSCASIAKVLESVKVLTVMPLPEVYLSSHRIGKLPAALSLSPDDTV